MEEQQIINKKANKFTRNILYGLGLFGLASMFTMFLILFLTTCLSFAYIKVDSKIADYEFNLRLIDKHIECNPQFKVKYIYIMTMNITQQLKLIILLKSVLNIIHHVIISKLMINVWN